MIKAILITAILFLSYAYFCDTLQVTLHHNAYKKNSSQIEIKCSGQVAKKEMILNLTISKDGRQFYSYNNRTNVETITLPIPGIPAIQRIEPGHFALTRINKTTSGNYNCTIFSNITRSSQREYIQVSGSNVLSNHLILPIVMIIISIFK